MFTITRGAKRLFGASLLAGLCWNAGASLLHAQAILVPDITVQPTPEDKSDAKNRTPRRRHSGRRFPLWNRRRTGLFLLPPTGSGYYTALDAIRGEDAEDSAQPYPYRPVFYDNDFRYLDKPDGKPIGGWNNIKRIHFGGLFDPCNDNWMLSIGGEERVQFKQENGGNNGKITGLNNEKITSCALTWTSGMRTSCSNPT